MKTFATYFAEPRRWICGALLGLGLGLAGTSAQAHVFGSISVSVPPVTVAWGNMPQPAVVYTSPVYTTPVYSQPVYSVPSYAVAPVVYGVTVTQTPYPPVIYQAPGHHGRHPHWERPGMGWGHRHGHHFD